MIWIFVTFPLASKLRRKRPEPETPGRETSGGKAGAGAYTSRGFGVGVGRGLGVASAVSGHRALASDVICDSNESNALEGRTVAFSPAETMTPINCPFASTTGDPIELDEIVAAISK